MNRLSKTLTASRLILRQARSSDADALFHAYCGEPDCAHYLTRGVHTSMSQTAEFLEKWCVHAWSKEDASFAWVIAERHVDLPIGIFLVIRNEDSAQIHFGIDKQHWGCGLVAEAGHAAITWLFENNTLRQLSTVCDAEHVRSQRVLEKLKFVREGLLEKHLVIPAFGPLARDGVLYSRARRQ
ncbi:MAG: GNAT family N-acetyltransferase [Comamonadaceae bacterium PBBC2]|nr:MAG: GNAT family N-acetyltransferase [Comamonadaceae bacterium PBBC2]